MEAVKPCARLVSATGVHISTQCLGEEFVEGVAAKDTGSTRNYISGILGPPAYLLGPPIKFKEITLEVCALWLTSISNGAI